MKLDLSALKKSFSDNKESLLPPSVGTTQEIPTQTEIVQDAVNGSEAGEVLAQNISLPEKTIEKTEEIPGEVGPIVTSEDVGNTKEESGIIVEEQTGGILINEVIQENSIVSEAPPSEVTTSEPVGVSSGIHADGEGESIIISPLLPVTTEGVENITIESRNNTMNNEDSVEDTTKVEVIQEPIVDAVISEGKSLEKVGMENTSKIEEVNMSQEEIDAKKLVLTSERMESDSIKEIPLNTTENIVNPSEVNSTALTEEEEKKEEEPTHQSMSLHHISMSSLQKSFDENELSGKAKKEEKKIEEIIQKEVAPELFGNYKPSFDGRAKKFFERLKIMRLKPKTRSGMVVGLIVITLLFIGYLFVFHPEKHSIGNYKTVIVEFFKKKTSTIDNTNPPPISIDVPINNETPTNNDTTQPDNTVVVETNTGTTTTQTIIDTPKEKSHADIGKEKIKNYFIK